MRGVVVVLLFPMLACGRGEHGADAEPPIVEAAYGERFTLSLDERADVRGFRVAFARVSEDSRCPEDLQCEQAGNAAAAFAVESDAGSATLTLNTDREPRRAAAMGRAISLVELRPRPVDGALPDTAYEATLIVEAAP